MNYSFYELQKQYKILIPQIQRDYAQGRIEKETDQKVISHDFIIKIIETLTSENSFLNLDFVYGYTKKISEDETAFIPLDGQQRLTTLWLLHWFLSPKKEFEREKIKMHVVDVETQKWLSKFTYEARNSSKRFCEELISNSLPVSLNVYEEIKDASWFMSSWQNDPTVISMLNMIKTIQGITFDKKAAWEKLKDTHTITFDYIDIQSTEFKLTDELYIKMNSRGKPLTEFENFKAQFTEILSAKDTDYVNRKLEYEGTKISYKEYFAFKIDSVWTDLFWNFEIEHKKDISSCFMNFFTYIAQICYFKDNPNKNVDDFKNDFSVFKRNDNILFLFKALDIFYKISIDEANGVKVSRIKTFFDKVFDKLQIFDNKVNLFEACLLEGNNFDNRNRIILYCLISYVIKYDLKESSTELSFYMRIIRNLLQATRQRKEIVYHTNVRINSFGNYWKLFSQILEKPNPYERLLESINNKETDISDDALINEKEKAKIVVSNILTKPDEIQVLFDFEEFKYFHGLIHNLNPSVNNNNFVNWRKYIKDIWNCSDELIVSALITCGFCGFYTKNCRLGEMWFFGKKDDWNTILAGKSKIDSEISQPIINLLEKYHDIYFCNSTLKPEKILEKIVQDFLDSLDKKDWQYYFCKYRSYFFTKSNYYSWKNDFECEILGNTGFSPLLSYHINPYVMTASKILDNSICQEKNCYTRYGDESCLILSNGFKLYSKQKGWKIEIPSSKTMRDNIRAKYRISDNFLIESDQKDRIDIVVEFCKNLVQSNYTL